MDFNFVGLVEVMIVFGRYLNKRLLFIFVLVLKVIFSLYIFKFSVFVCI